MRRIALALAGITAGVAALLAGGNPAGAAPDRSWAVIYVESHHTRGWHVGDAVKAWGLPSFRYGHCRAQYICAKVDAAKYGTRAGWVGITHYAHQGILTVHLNNSASGPDLRNVKRQASLHELGHVLGLEHDHTGCMVPMDDGRHVFITAAEHRAAAAERASDIADAAS